MDHAFLYKLSIAINILLACLVAVTVALLQVAKSEDVVRITLTNSQIENPRLAPLVSDLEQITGTKPSAVRLNGTSDLDATLWQLRFERK